MNYFPCYLVVSMFSTGDFLASSVVCIIGSVLLLIVNDNKKCLTGPCCIFIIVLMKKNLDPKNFSIISAWFQQKDYLLLSPSYDSDLLVVNRVLIDLCPKLVCRYICRKISILYEPQNIFLVGTFPEKS